MNRSIVFMALLFVLCTNVFAWEYNLDSSTAQTLESFRTKAFTVTDAEKEKFLASNPTKEDESLFKSMQEDCNQCYFGAGGLAEAMRKLLTVSQTERFSQTDHVRRVMKNLLGDINERLDKCSKSSYSNQSLKELSGRLCNSFTEVKDFLEDEFEKIKEK